MQPGLVSVTFRQLSPAEIIALVLEADLRLIEWGGDVHVPPGNIARAQEIGALTHDAGLAVAAYGSYYRVGEPSHPAPFERVLETAEALGAPIVRVWAGTKGSQEADAADRDRIVTDSQRICDLASAANIAVAYEFHGGTLADTADATHLLLSAVARPGLRTLWQPLGDADPEARTAEVESLLPWLANVHIYHWPNGRRAPLREGEAEWRSVLSALAKSRRPTGLLLEFVRDACPEQFLKDAATLRGWLSEIDHSHD